MQCHTEVAGSGATVGIPIQMVSTPLAAYVLRTYVRACVCVCVYDPDRINYNTFTEVTACMPPYT